jgi:integrase
MPRKPKRRPRGQGTVMYRSGSWWIRWREGGVRRAEKFPSEDIARAVLARIVGDLAAGRGGLEVKRAAPEPLSKLAEKWLARRHITHRSVYDDRGRWKNHLLEPLGRLAPDDVDTGRLRRLIEDKLAAGLSPTTVRLLMRLLSTFYRDLVEDKLAKVNPVKQLPTATRRLFRPAYDPKTTPYIKRADDIRRVFLALPEPINVAFAIGSMAGLRTGEVRALRWESVDLDRQKIHIVESVDGPLKDKDPREVPIQNSLLPVLREWHMRTGGKGLVVPPMRGGMRQHCDDHTMGRELRKALEGIGHRRLTWYQATRHTMASQWVLAGGSITKLSELLGHSTTDLTRRYAHCDPALFGPGELGRITVDLSTPGGKVIPMQKGADGYTEGTEGEEAPEDDTVTTRYN